MTFRPQTDLPMPVRNAILAAIVVLAATLDGYGLGRLSFWYDEVVTMRLARADGPVSLLRLLGEIDATRAPLHPLLLQSWLGLFGTSEFAGRSFSAVCGVATVLLIYRIGRDTFGISTGLWASWLAALSPLLVYYSREARMYAWLVMVTCACWSFLFRLKHEFARLAVAGYLIGLVALAYSHPLGLIMIATLALASGLFARILFGTWTRWFIVHAAAGLLIVPWLGHYLDHPPEHLSGRLPIKFLLGTPIGFIGGNFVTLAGFLALAGYGAVGHVKAMSDRSPGTTRAESVGPLVAPICLLIWLIFPTLALFLYSMAVHPIFGPARYTLFVAPAYLILVASGLSRLPGIVRYPLTLGMAGFSMATMVPMVFDPEIKGDWRAFATSIDRESSLRDGGSPAVIVMSADEHHNVEIETARYYLPADCLIVGSEAAEAQAIGERPVYLAVGSRRGKSVRPVPDRIGPYRLVADRSFPGLAVFRGDRGP